MNERIQVIPNLIAIIVLSVLLLYLSLIGPFPWEIYPQVMTLIIFSGLLTNVMVIYRVYSRALQGRFDTVKALPSNVQIKRVVIDGRDGIQIEYGRNKVAVPVYLIEEQLGITINLK